MDHHKPVCEPKWQEGEKPNSATTIDEGKESLATAWHKPTGGSARTGHLVAYGIGLNCIV
jgi:hypothetical protein